ncbi:MAG: TolC family protein [Acidobacteria bacterium]|nr:TolC family protein [Acidobacteriota bacterium]
MERALPRLATAKYFPHYNVAVSSRLMRISLLIPWLLSWCLAGTVVAQDGALDLQQALTAADLGNLELRAVRQQRAVALAGLKIAGQIPNPTISFAAARDLPHESLMWDQPLEIGGQRGKRRALASEEQKTTEIDIALLARQIRQRTRDGFYRVLLTRAQSEQSKTALSLAARIAEVVRQRFEAGDVAQLEVIQAEVEAARASADYDAALQTQKIADAQLAALLNRPLDQALSLRGRLDELPKPESLVALTEKALNSNGDVLRTTQELATEERRLGLAKALRIPNVDLQAGVDLNAPPDFNVGPRGQIAVALPLFNRGQGEVALSNAKLELLRFSLQAQRTNASVQVIAAYYDYAAKSGQSTQYGQRIVPQTVKLEEMAEDSYRSGKSNLLTLIDAQRRLSETRKTYLDSLFSVQSSFSVLEEVVGAPLD